VAAVVPRRLALLVAAGLLVAGCATTEQRGQRALYAGQYNDAIHLFQATLAEHPDRLPAMLGLGIALYKAGALEDAAATLDGVLARSPGEAPALLYRGLIALQQRDDAVAQDRLTRFRELTSIPSFGAQLDRALAIVRGGAADPAVREFIAVSLEDSVRSAHEVQAARLAAQQAYLSAFPVVRCVPARRGWVCF
jgi:tetratricopeptide (TPR) repeat protein